MDNKTSKKRWIRLALGTLIMLVLGLIYAWSVFAKPLEVEYSWSRAETAMTFTLSIIFFVIGLICTGFLSKKIPHPFLMLIAAALLAIGFIGCSRITSLAGLYVCYGIFVGLAVGIANNALVSSIVAWFPEKKGLASGILMMGFGLGGLLLTSIAQQMIESVGWRTVFLFFGIAFGVIVGAGSLVAKLPKPVEVVAFQPQQGAGIVAQDYPIQTVVRTKTYRYYIIWFTLVMAGGLLIIGHAMPFADSLGATIGFASVAAGLLSLFNGFGRVITGITADRLGLTKSMQLMTGYLFVASALLILALTLNNLPLLVLGFVFTGLSYGGGPTVSSVFASTYFGTKHFSMNYAALSAGMIPSAILGPYLAGQLYVWTGGYLYSFFCMLGFAVIAYLALSRIEKPSECVS